MIVDSSALVAVLRREPGFERLVDAMLDAEAVLVPAPCYLEVATVIAGCKGRAASRRSTRCWTGSGPGWRRSASARPAPPPPAFLRFGKGRHPAGLSFGDCMAYAVAQAEGAPLLFTGGDFARTDVAVAGFGG